MIPYYDESGVTIYHGDALELGTAAMMKTPLALGLTAPEWPAVITDPPYGVGITYDVFDDRRSDYWDWMRAALIAMRALGTPVVFTHRLAALRHLDGWDWIYCWNKPNAMSGLNQLPIMPHWEPIFAYGVTGRKDLPRGFDVFSFNPAVARLSDHPCPKPISLLTALVERFALPGQTVLDPFMGSGTTLVAAKSCGRPAVGIEISERYCEIAARRLGQEVLDFGATA